jgi:hypothetical protein
MIELEDWSFFAKRFYQNMGYEQLNIKLNPTDKVIDTKLSTRLKNILIKNKIITISDIENSNFLIYEGMGMVLMKEYNVFRYQYKLAKIFK